MDVPRKANMEIDRIHSDERSFLGDELEWNPDQMPVPLCQDYRSLTCVVQSPHPSVSDMAFRNFLNVAYEMMAVSWASVPFGVRAIAEKPHCDRRRFVMERLSKHFITPVMESAVFVFRFDGVTRSMTHQIVRHRAMAFSQQSMRVSYMAGAPCRIPVNIDPKLREAWERSCHLAVQTYKECITSGMAPEDARDLLPNGITTRIHVVMRFRELVQFVNDRTNGDTQEEHHYMVGALLEDLRTRHNGWYELLETMTGDKAAKALEFYRARQVTPVTEVKGMPG